jgi:hypothetical protein
MIESAAGKASQRLQTQHFTQKRAAVMPPKDAGTRRKGKEKTKNAMWAERYLLLNAQWGNP